MPSQGDPALRPSRDPGLELRQEGAFPLKNGRRGIKNGRWEQRKVGRTGDQRG